MKNINYSIVLYSSMLSQDSSIKNSMIKQKFSHVTSLRPECLQKLRNTSNPKQPRTHLLAYMSEFLEEKQQQQPQQADQFCCFDRIKRILHKKKNLDAPAHDTLNNHDSDKAIAEQNYKITKIIQLQARMRKMENNLEKYSQPSQFNTNQNSSAIASSQNKKSAKKPTSLLSMKPQKYRHTAINRKCMIEKLKQQAYAHYGDYQKQKIVDNQSTIKQYIEQLIEKKVDKILCEQDITFNQLSIQRKRLDHLVLQKNLEIQTLKTKQSQLLKKLQDLQLYRELVFQSEENKKKQTQNQKLAKQFASTFPNMSVLQVEREIENLNDKCLNKFYDIECKNWDKWNEEKGEYLLKIEKLEANLNNLKKKQNQLLSNINKIKYEHSLATMEVDSLIKDKGQLQCLQKKILSVYNNWYGTRSDSEKTLMKNLGYIKENYCYEEMIDYILIFQEKLSTNDKVNDYLIKILRGIMRIRKILFPKQNNQKLQPLVLLDNLEVYVKSKVYQKLYKKGNSSKNRSSQHFEEQFVFLHENKQNIQGETQ